MKKAFIILLLLFLSSYLFSQKVYSPGRILNSQEVDQKRLHFGFTLGLNIMDYAIRNSAKDNWKAEQVTFSSGFSVGIVSDLKLHEDFSLRFQPGLEFGERTILYSNDYDLSTYPAETTIESVVINLPLLLKYRAKRINNYRPYLVGGFSYKMDVQAPTKLDIDDGVMVRLEPNYFSLELGAGIDFYLPYFKFATELKLSLGLQDILNHKLDSENPDADFYTYSMSRMSSNVVTLSFHFE
ncbi:porin family protein [Ancylomarina sp. 16SWW S1-10-2]|uniref:type IX secretion/gliding motility protein PorT/SprT n=1 Tax=Ancylomarina sp. 16SWW S1-10-2 TaxID=2499681 RepID=UPI0012AE28AC|nr:porin family protein [Ancylomarina sp. 16SWW S1-10-2]MRT93396.1 PorT family protein [Ancylomarina sp. 16SWW S1-10-2]